ncbi:TMEM43 family protein [Smaragdicoccus niigatensis]|uniref:TMEM43 family protein n=1 Tax=Smaragdicoccus niigatensis TaxID=359359 RepID=UPI0012DE81BB|nr:TMEM43 family protein [Smaragdicoccus niigatensis]
MRLSKVQIRDALVALGFIVGLTGFVGFGWVEHSTVTTGDVNWLARAATVGLAVLGTSILTGVRMFALALSLTATGIGIAAAVPRLIQGHLASALVVLGVGLGAAVTVAFLDTVFWRLWGKENPADKAMRETPSQPETKIGDWVIAHRKGGIIWVLIAIGLMFYFETEFGRTTDTLNIGNQITTVDINHIDPAFEGKPVRIFGPLNAPGIAVDSEFGVSVEAPKLVRRVEMLQWLSVSEGGKRYDRKRWLSELSRRSRNGGLEMPLPGRVFALDGTVGDWQLPSQTLARLQGEPQTVNLDQSIVDRIQHVLGRSTRRVGDRLETVVDPENPQIGDVRIWYEAIRAPTVSAIGTQSGRSLAWFEAASDVRLLEIASGDRSARELIGMTMTNQHREDFVQRWFERTFAFGCLFGGLVFVSGYIPASWKRRLVFAAGMTALVGGFVTVVPWLV